MAGCTEQSNPTCAGPTCNPGTSDALPPQGDAGASNVPPIPPANGTYAGVRWEDCTSVVGTWEVPRGDAEPLVPEAFLPSGLSPATASLLFVATLCGRASTGTHVYTDTGYFHTLIRVEPVNESWSASETRSQFVLDFLVGSPELAAEVNASGLAVRAATLERDVASTPAGAEAQTWRITSGDLTAEFEAFTTGVPGTDDPGTLHRWYPVGDRFQRWDHDRTLLQDAVALEPVALRMTGPSATAPALANDCCAVAASQYALSFTEIWQGNQTTYGS